MRIISLITKSITIIILIAILSKISMLIFDELSNKQTQMNTKQSLSEATKDNFGNNVKESVTECSRENQENCPSFTIQMFKNEKIAISSSVQKLSHDCTQKQANSCYLLGLKFDRALGVKEDQQKAFQMYSMSCKLGYADGCTDVAGLHLTGIGNGGFSEAAKYFIKGCKLGDPGGCANIAVFHFNGEGVSQSYSKAIYYYEKACNGGVGISCYELSQLLKNGEDYGIPSDKEKAKKLLIKSCENKFMAACEE